MVLITIPVVFFSFLRTYRAMSFLTVPSIIIAVMGMITIFVYSFDKIGHFKHNAFEGIEYFNFYAVVGRIGVAMHIFAGNPSVINIYGEARNQHNYPRILKIAVYFCLILFVCYASVSYIAYRENT